LLNQGREYFEKLIDTLYTLLTGSNLVLTASKPTRIT